MHAASVLMLVSCEPAIGPVREPSTEVDTDVPIHDWPNDSGTTPSTDETGTTPADDTSDEETDDTSEGTDDTSDDTDGGTTPDGDTDPGHTHVGAPAYVSALAPLEMQRLTSVDNSVATWHDALPAEWADLHGSTNGLSDEFPGSHLWRDWSGGIPIATEHKLTAQGGGHTSAAMNGIIGFDFDGDDRPWGFYIENGSLSDVADVVVDEPTYSDGKANSHHTYDGIWYDPTADAIYRTAGSQYRTGNCTDNSYKFDRATGSWTELDSNGLGSICGATSFFDPNSRKAVVMSQSAYVVFDGATETYSSTHWLDTTRELNAVTEWDPARREGFLIQGLADGEVGMFRVTFDPDEESVDLEDVTSDIGGSEDMLETGYGPGFVFDELNGCYWAYEPVNHPGSLYRFDPDTLTFIEYTLTGDFPDQEGGKGTYKRLALFSDWGAIGFFGKSDDNAYVIRLPEGW